MGSREADPAPSEELLLARHEGEEAARVVFAVHARRNVKPISPYIYGVNTHCSWEGEIERPGMIRLGGNRWTAYNWTNNASNAGSDYRHQNDGWLGGEDRPGEALKSRIEAARRVEAAAVVTVPMAGFVAADKARGGDVASSGEGFLSRRFARSEPKKDGEFTYPPSAASGVVYQDEMVHWLESMRDPGDPPLFYALDNEPCLWSTTHPRIRPQPVTYAELTARSIAYASAIKDVAPSSLVMGPVSYGWMGFTNLQNAPDAGGRDFLEFYLRSMREASERQGRRLLDVLTVHWYPEARGGGERVTSSSAAKEVVEARVQATRSMWDPLYVEESWIARQALGAPIRLLPRLRARVEAHYPGTKIAITEYNFGGGGHISGGVAQADFLGILGREEVFAAAVWTLNKGPSGYVFGAMNMFLDYDGRGSRFGDLSVHAATDDPVRTSVYASVDAQDDSKMVLVAINKDARPVEARIRVTHTARFETARVFRLRDGSPTPSFAGVTGAERPNEFSVPLPPLSVSTIELR